MMRERLAGRAAQRGRRERRPRWARISLAAVSAVAGPILAPEPARAGQSTWNAATGDWSVPGNWTPSGVPTAGANVLLTNGTNVAAIVTADVAGIQVGALTIDGTNHGQATLSLGIASGSVTTSRDL